MTVVNSDGTISIMCGNGLRCAAAYLFAHDQTGPCFTINTDWGDLNVKV
jgi:diaminopimelate epimerase